MHKLLLIDGKAFNELRVIRCIFISNSCSRAAVIRRRRRTPSECVTCINVWWWWWWFGEEGHQSLPNRNNYNKEHRRQRSRPPTECWFLVLNTAAVNNYTASYLSIDLSSSACCRRRRRMSHHHQQQQQQSEAKLEIRALSSSYRVKSFSLSSFFFSYSSAVVRWCWIKKVFASSSFFIVA